MNLIQLIKFIHLFIAPHGKSLFIGVCVFFAYNASAQHYAFKQLTSNEGLIGSSVYSSIEDTAGFMWFATNRTVCRYDGKHFTNFGKAEGYTEEGAYFIYKDKRDVIWVISFNFKLFYFNGIRFVEFTAIPSASWLCEDDTGLIYVATRNKTIETIQHMHVVKTTPQKLGYNELWVFNIIALGNHKWLYSGEGSIYFANGNKTTKILATSCDRYVTPARLFKLANGNALLSICSNVYFFDAKTEKITLCYSEKDLATVGFYEDLENHDIMLGTNHGVLRFPQGKTYSAPAHFLKDKNIHAINKSKEGFYWFCSANQGVYYGNFLSRHVNEQDGLTNDVKFIRASKKQVFFSSTEGSITSLKDYGLSVTLTTLLPTSYSRIQRAVKLPNGEVHFVNIGMYPLVYSSLSGKYQRKNWVYFLFDNQEVHFYLRFDTISLFFNAKTQQPIFGKQIGPNVGLKKNTPYTTPNAILGDSTLIYIYDKGYLTATVRKNAVYYRKYPFYGITINQIVPTPSGNLILSTKANGVVIKTNKGKQYLNTSNGLVSNYCSNIYYENKLLWVCTEQGLSRIKLSSTDDVLSIENYTSDDYLLSNNVRDIAVTDSLVYVATDQGISIFNANKSINKYHTPLVYIRSATISGHQANHQQAIVIPYDQNNLSIYYEAITMKKVLPVSYRYRLKGVDTGYTYTTENNVNYAKLPAGKYQFIVYATSGNDIWSKYPATIELTVTEPFWQTTWFSLLLLLLAVLVVLLIIKRRDVLLRLKQENKKRLVESELKALRLQMNPHFIFNTLNSLQKFILQYKPIEANKYIAKFSRLMRWIMAYSDKQQITLQEELEFLNLYIELEQLRFINTFSSEINVEDTIDKNTVMMPSLVIQPFIENAIKYGLTEKAKTENGILQILFKITDNLLYVTIIDNGVGRAFIKQQQKLELNKPESTGIKSTTERLLLLHNNKIANPVVITDLFDHKNQATGTKVELIIPIKYA